MTKSNLTLCFVILPLFCSLFSCRNKTQVQEITRDGLAIACTKIPGDPGPTATVNYSARLIPDKKLLDKKEKGLSATMWYRMDSCFYLQDGNKKLYASIIQPIANGVTGSYEYFLSFDIGQDDDRKWQLIYQDKYLNQQKYSLSLGDQ